MGGGGEKRSDSLVDSYDNFTEMCDHAYLEEKEIIMIGDLNLDFFLNVRCSPKMV